MQVWIVAERGIVHSHCASCKDQPDIWNLVLSAEDGKNLTLNEMHSNADLFMLAGTDTTGETSKTDFTQHVVLARS